MGKINQKKKKEILSELIRTYKVVTDKIVTRALQRTKEEELVKKKEQIAKIQKKINLSQPSNYGK